MVRLIAAMFFGLTFLEGLTLGHVGLGVINGLVFVILALLAVRFSRPQWGETGLVYSMSGAFFLSLLTPFVLFAGFGPTGGLTGDDELEVTVDIPA